MKNILFASLLVLVLSVNAQNKSADYVILLNRDTVFISDAKPSYWRPKSKIKCNVAGNKTSFIAKNIIELNVDGVPLESGKVRPNIIGFKKWIFLQREINGKVCLYTISSVMKTNHNTTGTYELNNVTIFFYRKSSEPQGKFYKLVTYKKLDSYLSDCPAFVSKLKDTNFKTLKEEINYYNDNCK